MDVRVVTCSASSIAGIKNFGDELLTEIFHRWLGACDIPVTSSHLSVGQHGVLSRRARDDMDGASGMMFTGGGYFADGDTGPGHVVRLHLRALRNRRVYWTVFKRAQSRALPCAVVGLEVGPLRNPWYRRAVAEILSKSRVVVVRNETSRANAEELLGASRDILVHLDAALTVNRADIEGDSSGLWPSGEEDRSEDLRIGLHIHSLDGEAGQAACVTLVRKIQSQAPANRRVQLYYIHDQTKGGRHPQRSLRAEHAITGAFPGTVVVAYRKPVETLQAIGAMDLLVTSKLHGGVVARALEVPVLSLGVHPKIRRFYDALGEGYACGSASDFARSGLPDPIASRLGVELRTRVPVSPSAKESAGRNREAVARFVHSLAGK